MDCTTHDGNSNRGQPINEEATGIECRTFGGLLQVEEQRPQFDEMRPHRVDVL
jgi:hypothetical protein